MLEQCCPTLLTPLATR